MVRGTPCRIEDKISIDRRSGDLLDRKTSRRFFSCGNEYYCSSYFVAEFSL